MSPVAQVSKGADATLTDDEGRQAIDCIPPVAEDNQQARVTAERVCTLLREAVSAPPALPSGPASTAHSEGSRESGSSVSDQGEGLSLEEAGLKLGDAVIVGPQSSNPKVCGVCVVSHMYVGIFLMFMYISSDWGASFLWQCQV